MEKSNFLYYPATDLVILAGGQARRMGGQNKLRLNIDGALQFIKIYRAFYDQVAQIWINSSQDIAYYRAVYPALKYFADDTAGYYGPLMGMKSAWSHVNTDYILFIPCDITYIAADILLHMHRCLAAHQSSQVVVACCNGQLLYPFCLLKRASLSALKQSLQQQQFSLRRCFKALHMQSIAVQCPTDFHSINSTTALLDYQQALKAIGHKI
ncbi:NTP transferase domain-containing protein [Acinetobacter larvae]|uniref:Molybdenum cofactor guanylyltransferase n=1 Tax=Acinetobacter larvae TaxID=1789224 RepID=A0A1B2M071_9GAMM|nr:NTP transferase domain-containing protein [Acinetobacter larvae]AOA58578.1 molybdenum cofactor guanylyltransferase [Acinetobacter larvae]